MRRGCSLIALLAVVGTAFAVTPDGTVEIFMTSSSAPYGLTRPENALSPTGNVVDGVKYYGYDLTDLGAGVPYALQNPGTMISTPTAPVEIDAAHGEFAYIWMKMTQVNIGARINGFNLQWGAPEAIDGVNYYMVDDTGAGAAVGEKRWQLVGAEWESHYQVNPVTLASTSSASIRMSGLSPQSQLLQQFYGNETHGSTLPIPAHADALWLLGAVSFDSAFRGDVSGMLVDYPIVFSGMVETDPAVPTTILGARIVPEPTALLLLATLGVLIRQR